MDFIDPFLTFYEHHPDHGASDARNETEALVLRQRLITDFIEGHESAEAVLDCLEEQGLGADAYAAEVEASVQRIVSSGRVYLENESGLLLPEVF
jgi:hypothetical protein